MITAGCGKYIMIEYKHESVMGDEGRGVAKGREEEWQEGSEGRLYTVLYL